MRNSLHLNISDHMADIYIWSSFPRHSIQSVEIGVFRMLNSFWKSASVNNNHILGCNGNAFALYKGSIAWLAQTTGTCTSLANSLFHLFFFTVVCLSTSAFLLLLTPSVLYYQVLFLLYNAIFCVHCTIWHFFDDSAGLKWLVREMHFWFQTMAIEIIEDNSDSCGKWCKVSRAEGKNCRGFFLILICA